MKLIRCWVDCSETRIFSIMSTGTQILLQTIESIKVIGFVRESKWSPLRNCRGSGRARHRWDAWDRLKCFFCVLLIITSFYSVLYTKWSGNKVTWWFVRGWFEIYEMNRNQNAASINRIIDFEMEKRWLELYAKKHTDGIFLKTLFVCFVCFCFCFVQLHYNSPYNIIYNI